MIKFSYNSSRMEQAAIAILAFGAHADLNRVVLEMWECHPTE